VFWETTNRPAFSRQIGERVSQNDGTPSAYEVTGEGGVPVLYYALVFLIVGLIAGVLGATGVAAIASQIAWILFIVGIILLVIHLATGRRPVV
jgi:uncharacterized membrane protein YtjA (UPF0391 family)